MLGYSVCLSPFTTTSSSNPHLDFTVHQHNCKVQSRLYIGLRLSRDNPPCRPGQKRKRDVDFPRITFHAPERTFDRLFKEESLSELRDVVKSKLSLPKNVDVVLKQLRNGKIIDLDDDDDFDAFYLLAHTQSVAEVQVSIQKPGHRPSWQEHSRHRSTPPAPISLRPAISRHISKKPRSEAPPTFRENSQPKPHAKRPLSAVAGTSSDPISISVGPALKKQKVYEGNQAAKPEASQVTFDEEHTPEATNAISARGRNRKRHKKCSAEASGHQGGESEPISATETPGASALVPPAASPATFAEEQAEKPPKKKKKKKAHKVDGVEVEQPALAPGPPVEQVELSVEVIAEPSVLVAEEAQPVEAASESVKKKKKKKKASENIQVEELSPTEEEVVKSEEKPVFKVQEDVRMTSVSENGGQFSSAVPVGSSGPALQSKSTPDFNRGISAPTKAETRPSLEDPQGDTALKAAISADLWAVYHKVVQRRQEEAATRAKAKPKPKPKLSPSAPSATTNKDDPIVLSDDNPEKVKSKTKRKVSKAVKKEETFAEDVPVDEEELPSIVIDKKSKRKVSKAVKKVAGPAVEEIPVEEAPTVEDSVDPTPTGPRGLQVVVELKPRKRNVSQAAKKDAQPHIEELEEANEVVAADDTPPARKRPNRKLPKAVEKDAVQAAEEPLTIEPPTVSKPVPPEGTASEDKKPKRRKSLEALPPPSESQPDPEPTIQPANVVMADGEELPVVETPVVLEPASVVVGELPPKQQRRKSAKAEDLAADEVPTEEVQPETNFAVAPKPKRASRTTKKKDVAPVVDEPRAEEMPVTSQGAKSSKASMEAKAFEPEHGASASAECRPPRLSRASSKVKTPATVEDSDNEAPDTKLDDEAAVSGAPATEEPSVNGQAEAQSKPTKLTKAMKRRKKSTPVTEEPLGPHPLETPEAAVEDEAIVVDSPPAPSLEEPSIVLLPQMSAGNDQVENSAAPVIADPIESDTPESMSVDNAPVQSASPSGESAVDDSHLPPPEAKQQRSIKQGESAKDKEMPMHDQAEPKPLQSAKVIEPADEDSRSQHEESEVDKPAAPSVEPTPRANSPSDATLSPDLKPSQISSAFRFPFSLPEGTTDIADYSNVDLDALIRGPPTSQISVADLVSPPESSGESDSDGDDEPQELLVEDMEEPKVARRSSRKPVVMDTSDSENSEEEGQCSSMETERVSRLSRPESPITARQHDRSFLSVDRMVESERELDDLGDTAFHDAFAADEEPIQHLNEEELTPKPNSVEHKAEVLLENEPQVLHKEEEVVENETEEGKPETPVSPVLAPTTKHIIEDAENVINAGKVTPHVVEPSAAEQLPTPDGSEANEDESQPSQRAKLRVRGQGHATEAPKPKPKPVTQNNTRSAKKPATKATPKPLQTLSSYAPPRLISQAAGGRQLRSHKKATQSQDSQDQIMEATQWEVLKPAGTSSPAPEADSSGMIDELHSDAPDLANEASDAEYPFKRPPLFVLTESQPPFPYSQFADDSKTQSQQNSTIRVRAKDDTTWNDSEDEEGEVEASVTPVIKKLKPPPSQFRRLTEFARDHSMFSTPRQRRSSRASLIGASEKKQDLYGRIRGKEDSESDSGSEDSDDQPASHIPRNRRAGINRAKK